MPTDTELARIMQQIKRTAEGRLKFYVGIMHFLNKCSQDEFDQFQCDYTFGPLVSAIDPSIFRELISKEQLIKSSKQMVEFYITYIRAASIDNEDNLQQKFDALASNLQLSLSAFEKMHALMIPAVTRVLKPLIKDNFKRLIDEYTDYTSGDVPIFREMVSAMSKYTSVIGKEVAALLTSVSEISSSGEDVGLFKSVKLLQKELEREIAGFDALYAKVQSLEISTPLIDNDTEEHKQMLRCRNSTINIDITNKPGWATARLESFNIVYVIRTQIKGLKDYRQQFESLISAHKKQRKAAAKTAAKTVVTSEQPVVASVTSMPVSSPPSKELLARQREAKFQEEIDALNKAAAVQKAESKTSPRLSFSMHSSSGSSIAASVDTPPVDIHLFELNKTNYETLEKVWAEEHNSLTYPDLEKLAVAVGATVTKVSGSSRKFTFQKFDMYTLEPTGGSVARSLHQPHGAKQGQGLFLGVYVKQFKDAFIQAGITPEKCRRKNELRP